MSNLAETSSPASTASVSPVNRFHRTVWRWHFYAGLFVIPFMLVLATTGIIYLFKPQLDGLMYHHLLSVSPSGVAVPYGQQVAAVQATYPGSDVSKIVPNIAPDRSTEVQISTADGRNLMVFVNPHTAEVLGDRNEDTNLQAIARKIHGELMIGRWGDYLVELAACWALVLLLSGVYLWLPRHRFNILGTLVPRLWSPNKRIVWRDLHAVPGFYGVLLIGFLILTGLPWSGFWGETFANVWGRFPAQLWDDIPQSSVMTGVLNQRGATVVPWAVEKLPMPQSGHSTHTHGEALSPHSHASVDLDTIIAIAQEQGAPPGFSVTLPTDENGVYTASAFPNDPTQEVTLHIDQYSGQVLADVRWKDYGLVPKAVEMGVAIHMGKYFGLGNQLLMLLACLIVILLCVSGLVMWWHRRPSDRLGAPEMPAVVPSWRVPLAIVAVLGVAFPLVGFSLVTVLLLDYLVISRIPPLKRTLG